MILQYIRRIRENHRRSINDIANALHTSPAYISRVERGLIMPSVKFLEDYLSLFDLTLSYKQSSFINQKQLEL